MHFLVEWLRSGALMPSCLYNSNMSSADLGKCSACPAKGAGRLISCFHASRRARGTMWPLPRSSFTLESTSLLLLSAAATTAPAASNSAAKAHHNVAIEPKASVSIIWRASLSFIFFFLGGGLPWLIRSKKFPLAFNGSGLVFCKDFAGLVHTEKSYPC